MPLKWDMIQEELGRDFFLRQSTITSMHLSRAAFLVRSLIHCTSVVSDTFANLATANNMLRKA